MTTLWFVMPAHGRTELTGICLRQLRRTCDALAGHGIEATAVVIANDRNLETARELGFGTVRRDNRFLARKFNDGIQLAADPQFNPRPADYVVPIGSDDWVDPIILHRLPPPSTVLAFRRAAFVSETGHQLSEARLDYPGGVGVRVYPRQLLAVRGYRPADEDRKRACDTSILTNIRAALHRNGHGLQIAYGDRHPRQIVDWKSPRGQLNSYADITARHRAVQAGDPFGALKGIYPDQALEEMAAHYEHLSRRRP